MTRAILLGAGGHARVVLALARSLGFDVVGVCDPTITGQWQGLVVLGDDSALRAQDRDIVLLNGLGKLPGGTRRRMVQDHWQGHGFAFPALVHPAAWVAPDAALGAGVQVMAGAVAQLGCRIGAGTIVYTRAGVDHDCTLGTDVHIGPGATLCGGVTVGDGAFVGAGATVVQGLTLGAEAVLAAGAVLVRDLGAGQTGFGQRGRI